MWNSNNEKLRRIIWRCNGKYPAKGEKGCETKHIDDAVLYQAFINTFNALIENKDYFIGKCQEKLVNGNVLQRYKAGQFIRTTLDIMSITEFDVDLYFALVEKMTVYEDKRIIVGLLDGTAVECEIE